MRRVVGYKFVKFFFTKRKLQTLHLYCYSDFEMTKFSSLLVSKLSRNTLNDSAFPNSFLFYVFLFFSFL